MRRTLASALAAFVGLTLGAGQLVYASDHMNPEEGIPLTYEDAYPIAYMGREFQTSSYFERTAEGKDRFRVAPIFEYGLLRNAQVKVVSPFLLGSADKTGSGDVGLEGLYNFFQEPLIWPAVSLAARADFPTGKNDNGVDPTVKLILTKSIGRTRYFNRLHLNGHWKYNAGRHEDERLHRYGVAAGYDFRLGPDTLILLDGVREQEREKEKVIHLAEVGVRRQIDPLTVLALGVGAGIGRDSPDVRVTLGFQRSITMF